MPDYLTALGFKLYPNGNRLVGRCLVHNDCNPSFAVFGETREMCGCYPCNYQGDVFKTSQWLGRSTSFPEAVQDVAFVLGMVLPQAPAGRVTWVPRPIDAPKAMTVVSRARNTADEKQIQRAKDEFAAAFSRGDEIIDRISADLGIDRDVLGKVAGEPSGLGLSHSYRGRTWLCYTYPEGLKWRNPEPYDPRFLWLTGNANAPWRAERIKPETETVYLTEGESDCLALVASGLEDDGITVCVASPGTSVQQKWATMFSGKRVVLNFDPDNPGRAALRTVANFLRPYATSIEILNLPGPTPNDCILSN